jgi:hypothetical protein
MMPQAIYVLDFVNTNGRGCLVRASGGAYFSQGSPKCRGNLFDNDGVISVWFHVSFVKWIGCGSPPQTKSIIA